MLAGLRTEEFDEQDMREGEKAIGKNFMA